MQGHYRTPIMGAGVGRGEGELEGSAGAWLLLH
jgi:hypothetical protein